MPRARNIKHAFFQNEKLGSLEPLARLLFIGMWTIADFKGCLEFRPMRMKAQLLPYDNCNVTKLVINLEQAGFILIYAKDGTRFIKIVNFLRHQNPHKNEREAGSCIPDYEEKYKEINGLSQDGTKPDFIGLTPADSLFLIPDSLSLNPDSKTIASNQKKEANPDTDFMKFWEIYPKRPGANRTQAWKAWQARLKNGIPPLAILDGARRYRKYCEAMDVEPQFIKQASTFLGPDNHFLLDWKAEPRKGQDFADKLTGREWLKDVI
jgi:hypothetical protein